MHSDALTAFLDVVGAFGICMYASVCGCASQVQEAKLPPSVMKLPGSGSRVSVGNYFNFVVVNDKRGNFYQWQAGNWIQQPGSASSAAIGEDGEMWISTLDGNVFRRTPGGWLSGKSDHV